MKVLPLLFTFTYLASGLTQSAKLASKVQGVVVQAKKYTSSSTFLIRILVGLCYKMPF